MSWIQLTIRTEQDRAEAIGDSLSELGAQAVTFVDAKDTPVYEPKPGEVHYWPNTEVIGLFDAEDDTDIVIAALQNDFGQQQPLAYTLNPLEDKDWEREWMDNFHPIQFGKRLWICPSWRDIPDPDAVNVMLDPGVAFGTGTHPTTALCLRWLDSLDLTDKTVVDFGCGSGILGIAALKLGAKRVIGIDIDPQALEASQANAERNGVGDQIELYLPENQPQFEADVVVANILAGPLRELQSVITDYCHPVGVLALSGILVEQAEEIEQLYARDFILEPVQTEGDWAMVSGFKK
ncbi:Ribosomal protein L11 methyltransferase [Saliniradius amylolyticus]|uniref:Ribosomal protein L11 methyltransferase n=1 Tax=Saliniradius amylolyticus TaxID=2183582 RepID=A0A2S2E7W8_9ALTE|nr:50S ribosomal protein L11 methyltransferase [Saliniradius amylolyticus]AWL13300.1 Ribosomal protein L11 methyltransferase [Saliniradius amylolyticus]